MTMNEQQLIRDLRATFPKLNVEFDYPFSTELVGVAMRADPSTTMPDGLPIFDDYAGVETHDDGVHSGFAAWLHRRGWYVEPYGYGSWCAIPLPTQEEIERYAACQSAVSDDCPF
ncbi:hypothetical protein CUJ91_04710 [Paraburkholderia graminis]|uniref:hypothetical protein n=1 Tax=Paraburkholderia graminis TaxID=60548 RepID=UPI000DEED52C|nr:hypothetical protein [Paraburkholderia graminis]AXF07298.1 hypothetical protein CUJ91_04710 [Paraburkholderia graminis]